MTERLNLIEKALVESSDDVARMSVEQRRQIVQEVIDIVAQGRTPLSTLAAGISVIVLVFASAIRFRSATPTTPETESTLMLFCVASAAVGASAILTYVLASQLRKHHARLVRDAVARVLQSHGMELSHRALAGTTVSNSTDTGFCVWPAAAYQLVILGLFAVLAMFHRDLGIGSSGWTELLGAAILLVFVSSSCVAGMLFLVGLCLHLLGRRASQEAFRLMARLVLLTIGGMPTSIAVYLVIYLVYILVLG